MLGPAEEHDPQDDCATCGARCAAAFGVGPCPRPVEQNACATGPERRPGSGGTLKETGRPGLACRRRLIQASSSSMVPWLPGHLATSKTPWPTSARARGRCRAPRRPSMPCVPGTTSPSLGSCECSVRDVEKPSAPGRDRPSFTIAAMLLDVVRAWQLLVLRAALAHHVRRAPRRGEPVPPRPCRAGHASSRASRYSGKLSQLPGRCPRTMRVARNVLDALHQRGSGTPH